MSEPEARPAGWLARSGEDLHALVARALDALRGGSVAAVVATIPLAIVALATFFIALAAMPWRPRGSSEEVAIVVMSCAVHALGLAFLQAGALAAFGLAARGSAPTSSHALGRAARRVPRLWAATFLFFGAPLLAFMLAAITTSERRGDRPPVAALEIAWAVLVVWAHVRYFLLQSVVLVVEDETGFFESFRRAHALGRGRFPLLLAATVAPCLVVAAAQPSAIGLAAMGAGSVAVLAQLVAFAGWIAFFFLRPALAAAAYAVTLAPPSPDEGG